MNLIKKIEIVVISVLLITSGIVFVFENTEVKAEQGGGGEGSGEIWLDFDYLWEQLYNISNVIYTAYNETDIRKGRFFGSKGGEYAADIIIDEEMKAFGLENVHLEQIQHINEDYHNYTTMIDVVGYNLTVNNETYEYSNNIPKSEFFPMVSAREEESIKYTYNTIFENSKIIHNNLRTFIPEAFFNQEYIISDFFDIQSIEGMLLWGNLTYILYNQTPPGTAEQQGRIYLLEEDGYSQNIIDNLSTANGCILIETGESQNLNLKGKNFVVKKINQTSGSDVKQILENYSDVNCDNLSDIITMSYDLDDSSFPSSEFIIIDRVPNHYELADDDSIFLRWIDGRPYDDPNLMDYAGCYCLATQFYYNRFENCKGIILYSAE